MFARVFKGAPFGNKNAAGPHTGASLGGKGMSYTADELRKAKEKKLNDAFSKAKQPDRTGLGVTTR